jgi:hypothetical protein
MIAPSARDDIAGHPYTRQKPRKLRFLMTDNIKNDQLETATLPNSLPMLFEGGL